MTLLARLMSSLKESELFMFTKRNFKKNFSEHGC